MPIYEYRCNTCGCKFERLRPMSSADSPTTCPDCGGSDAERLVSRFAAFSKGNGGTTTSVGGSSCGSCSSSSCASCQH